MTLRSRPLCKSLKTVEYVNRYCCSLVVFIIIIKNEKRNLSLVKEITTPLQSESRQKNHRKVR